MEKILEAANRLGHLLRQNEIVKRYGEIAEKLEKDEAAKKLLDEFASFSAEYRQKEEDGSVIEVDEKKKLKEFNDRIKENQLISEFIATQAYYMNILQQVNEAIANPQGVPPRESTIITPENDKRIIL